MKHEICDERLLERGREPFHELRRQAPNEPDSVGHEIPLAEVLEGASRRIERLEEPVVDRRMGTG